MVTARTSLMPRLPRTTMRARGFLRPGRAAAPPEVGTFEGMAQHSAAVVCLPWEGVRNATSGSTAPARDNSGFGHLNRPDGAIPRIRTQKASFPEDVGTTCRRARRVLPYRYSPAA